MPEDEVIRGLGRIEGKFDQFIEGYNRDRQELKDSFFDCEGGSKPTTASSARLRQLGQSLLSLFHFLLSSLRGC